MSQPYKLIPCINLLPQGYRPRLLSLLEVFLILLLLVELGAGYFNYQAKVASKADLVSLQAQLDKLTKDYQAIRPKIEKITTLRSQLEEERAEQERIKAAYRAIAPPSIGWGSLTAHIFSSAPRGIALKSVTQNGIDLILKGSSPSPEVVSLYSQALRQSPEISQASLQSLLKEESPPSYSFTLMLRLRERK